MLSETSYSGSILNNTSGASCRHVVAVPYPGRGHVNPMMNLCKLLAHRSDVLITFVLTEEWIGLIGPAPELPNIRLRSIPNVIPSELNRAADFSGFIKAVATKMEDPFELLLEQLESPVEAIIADTYLSWAVAVANQRNIPLVSLWTMSPSVFSIFYHFDLLTENRHFPADLSESGEEIIDYIPGLSSTRLADFPTFFSGVGRQVLGEALEAFSWVRKAQSVVFTSFYELEPHVINTLKIALQFPVYSVGPLIPHTTLADDDTYPAVSHSKMSNNYCFKWLDSQPEKSVLYVSLGSFLSVSREQMDEVVAGMRASGVRFLWVARGDTERVQEACGEMGLVVPWCDQLKVLCHVSIGGFWTHCGWNSTLEGVFAGVPMLTFPIFYDQIPDGKLIVDDWKVGMKLVGAEELVRREEIACIVQKFMDLEGGESKEMRRRASELKQKCRSALAKDGSSETNINAFIREILKCQLTHLK